MAAQREQVARMALIGDLEGGLAAAPHLLGQALVARQRQEAPRRAGVSPSLDWSSSPCHRSVSGAALFRRPDSLSNSPTFASGKRRTLRHTNYTGFSCT